VKLKMSKSTSVRKVSRLTKKIRIRKTVVGTLERPRLCIFRSSKHMYAQIVNDAQSKTILSVSSLNIETDKTGKELAQLVGKEIAKVALSKGIKSVVFDRNGFIYHGRVKALADGAREAGLNF
jgi:large subunit ribosomal protein L18